MNGRNWSSMARYYDRETVWDVSEGMFLHAVEDRMRMETGWVMALCSLLYWARS